MALDPMAEIRASFFVECEELLESLQDALATMGNGEHDNETINVVFRAVHSIKGGAGAFGLNDLVAFAHRYETVLDELRAGRLEITPERMKQFFQAADLLQDHVRAARDGSPLPEGAEEVLQEMEQCLNGGAGLAAVEEEEVADFVPMTLGLDLDDGEPFALPDLDLPNGEVPPLGLPALDLPQASLADPDIEGGDLPPEAGAAATPWHITFSPAAGLYTSGNEPLHILRALSQLGTAEIQCDSSKIPPLEALNPEAALLSWGITLPGSVREEDIREVFDFIEDVCTLTLTRQTAAPETYDSQSEGDPRETTEFHPASADDASPEADLKASVSDASQADEDAAAQTTEQSTAASATPASAQAAQPTAAKPVTSETVRVDIERIDRLVNLVGELVINQAMLAQSVAESGLPPSSNVMTGLEAFMMLTRDIQDSVMMIRAQPVKPLFQRMARIVREASSAVEKDVRLKSEGEATEIDKTVIERLADPLTHMIRNAVDHGLESREQRLAAGKPPEGVITLSAQHRSGRVVIEISDDGAGINRPRVREIAANKGLIPADAQLSDSEIDNLLFLPGFSTASTISALSGRGVGMDVVKQAIQGLGGRITISSEKGKGTKFSISLPLTLAVLDGMVVSVAGETLVVPLNSILETATLATEDIRSLGPHTNVIHVRGEFVPLYDLGAELGYRTIQDSYDGGVVLLTTQEDGSRSALVVDLIMEQRQVVIKGLQQSYGNIPGVAAATILGDGQIALILDPADLVTNATGRTRNASLPLAG